MGNQNEREVSMGLGWGRGDWGLVLKVNLGRVKGKATEGWGERNQRCSKKRWSLCHWESIGEGRGELVNIFEKPK